MLHKNKLLEDEVQTIKNITDIRARLEERDVIKHEKGDNRSYKEFKNKTIILFEQEDRLRVLLGKFLQSTFQNITLYSVGDDVEYVFKEIKSHEPSLLIFDLSPKINIELLERLSVTSTKFPIIIISTQKVDKL